MRGGSRRGRLLMWTYSDGEPNDGSIWICNGTFIDLGNNNCYQIVEDCFCPSVDVSERWIICPDILA